MRKKNPKLKICPFCLSDAHIEKSGAVVWVECNNCGSMSKESWIFDYVNDSDLTNENAYKAGEEIAEQKAIDIWNNRPPESDRYSS